MINKIKNAVFIAAAMISINSTAQNFEGKVNYELSFPGMEIPDEQKAMMPKEMIMYCKGVNSRVEMAMGMGMTQTTISDGKKKEAITLMDIMGNKTAIKSTEEDMKKKTGESAPVVKLLDETKTVAGYKCKKAIITIKDKKEGEITMPVWYTEEITTYNSQWASQYKGIKGMMMEYEIKASGMTMKMTAKSVTKEAVSDAKFTIPEGYKVMTAEEFQKSMGSMGQ